MGERGDEKAAGPARRIDHLLSGTGIDHLHHHFYDVPGREELSLRAAQRRTDEHFERITYRVTIGVDDGVRLKLSDDVRQARRIEVDAIRRLEDVTENGLLDPLEEAANALLDVLGGILRRRRET